jgi:hypothetical protein
MQRVKKNTILEPIVTDQLIELLKEFKDVFAWTYKDLKGIPPKIVQHRIELDTIIPFIHQARYRLNPNYVIIVKQDIDKLFVASFIKPIEKATWMSPIVVHLTTRNLVICNQSPCN